MATRTGATTSTTRGRKPAGLKVGRRFTTGIKDPFAAVEWTTRASRITNPDGSVVFAMEDAEVPASWSQVTTDIMVSKYFRKAGVPRVDDNGKPIVGEDGEPVLGPERSAKQVIHRLAGTWRHWGENNGYFATKKDAQNFEDELKYMLANQMAAPNSPQWFNTGLAWAYDITGPAQGHFYIDPASPEVVKESEDAYTRPQPHACQPFHALVSTPDGPMPIGEIVTRNLIGQMVYDGTDEGRGTTKVVAVKSNGQKLVHRVILKNGVQIEATGDHLVYAVDERRTPGRWLRVDELQSGQRLQLSTVTDVIRESSETDILEAALAGWLQGDGFVGQYAHGTNRSLTIEFMTINEAEHAFVMERVNQIFEGIHVKVRSVESKDADLDVRRIRLYGEKLRPFVEKYDLLRETPNDELEVPTAVFVGGREAQAAYLQALFQADGTVRLRDRQARLDDVMAATKVLWAERATDEKMQGAVAVQDRPVAAQSTLSRTSDIVLTTVSERLASGVQALLLNMGIYSRISIGNDKRANRRVAHQVSIGYADSRARFADLIGFISADKQGKLAVACSGTFPGKRLPSLREEIIDRIEAVGVQDVYDIQTESGQYLSNNVIVHNCFIQHVGDDLVNDNGIMDLWVREARLFKYGSGTGTNFSNIRGEGEPLSGGGSSSGLMSFLKVGDRAAGAIKSGGTTRRAAKMVTLDVDHPDIMSFVDWKPREELKVAAMVEGMRHLTGAQQARARELGLELSFDYNGEAYATVSGQNSNNSVRLTNGFIDAVRDDREWDLIRRTDGSVHRTVKARDIWTRIAEAAWQCADPGVQFDTTINEWHTSPAGGRINASNPCSEYMFLDNTACNLASLNLMKFIDGETGEFRIDDMRHATRLWTIVLEISVLMAQFPSKEIARLSYDYRTLGLGYANIGTVLMILGMPYDSDEARAYTGAVTALMTGESYAASAEMASVLGPFPEYEANSSHMLRVIRNHRRAAHDAAEGEYEGLSVLPMGINAESAPTDIHNAAKAAWDTALAQGEKHGYRNAQTTLLAPTGTIGLLMDCDTTGVEPDFALVKFKKLAGGGYFKIANQSIAPALRNLGYDDAQRKDILDYVLGTMSLDGAPHINTESLKAKGLNGEDIAKVEKALPAVFELGFAFNAWALGEDAIGRLGLTMEQASKPGFELLRAIGFTRAQIDEANEAICGTMAVEGAPHLKAEHYPVFDTANKSGRKGTRFIQYMGHITMMAAAQSFLSGAISKTINMPNEVTVEDVEDAYYASWKHGIKAMALYRDGSKMSQPLSNKSDTKVEDEEVKAVVNEAVAEKDAEIAALKAQVVKLEAEKTTGVVASALGGQQQLPGMPHVATRRRLPSKRHGFTQEARVAGHKVYLRTGEYEDGTIGEVFIDMHKEGAAFRSMINSFAIAISKGLQYGVPLQEYVDTFTFVRFEPQGMVAGHPNIKLATSVIDYVFRVLGLEYLGRTDLVQVEDAPPPIDQTGEHEDLQPKEEDMVHGVGPSPAQRIASPDAPSVPTIYGNGNGHANGGGNGNGHDHEHSNLGELEVQAKASVPVATASAPVTGQQPSASDQMLGEMMGDAPFCDVCGHVTVRNGSCYKCLNCGNSLGCS